MKQSSVWWQFVIPQHLISRAAGCLAQCRWPWLKNWAIRAFMQRFGVELQEAVRERVEEYAHFNDFFTRHLKPAARPIAQEPFTLVSPVDGSVSEIGRLAEDTILQAKGKHYSLLSLLGGDPSLAARFTGGEFLTAYLSPKDYHRIHMPCDGRLVRMDYVPGKLFSVNAASVAQIDQLFARNERVICLFDSPEGPFALVLVGALIVGSIATHWHGVVNGARGRRITSWDYRDKTIDLRRGDELGYFQLGSTVIALFPKDRLHWRVDLTAGTPLRMGEMIAKTF